MNRHFALTLVLWTLVLVPGLCVAGLLVHPCVCPETSCGHEELCADDPCSTPATADARDVRAPIVPVITTALVEAFLRPTVALDLKNPAPDAFAFEAPAAAPTPLLI